MSDEINNIACMNLYHVQGDLKKQNPQIFQQNF